MGRNGFHIGSTSDIAYGAVMLATIAITIGVIGWVLPIQKPDTDILANHVHTPNVMVLATPNWQSVADPFTTTSITPVALPGLVVGPVRQQNATHGFWLLILAQLTIKISAGIGNIQLECDGASCGSGGSFSNTNYQTVSIFIMQNNTFTDNLPHVLGVDISSDNVAHTISVCAIDSTCYATGLGNFVSLFSVADLSSSPPR